MKIRKLFGFASLIAGLGLIVSCHLPKNTYYSAANPHGIVLYLKNSSSVVYTDAANTDSWQLVVKNTLQKPFAFTDPTTYSFQLKGLPRLSKKYKNWLGTTLPHFTKQIPSSLAPGDSVVINLGNADSLFKAAAWKIKNTDKPNTLLNSHRYYADVHADLSYQGIHIVSEPVRVHQSKSPQTILTYKSVALYMSPAEINWKPGTSQTVEFSVENKGNEPIQLFENPQTFRMNIYGYGYGKPGIMELKLTNEAYSAIKQVVVQPGQRNVIFSLNLAQVLYKIAPEGTAQFWTWKRKANPVSPAYRKGKGWVPQLEIWYSITVSGKAYLSPPIVVKVLPETNL